MQYQTIELEKYFKLIEKSLKLINPLISKVDSLHIISYLMSIQTKPLTLTLSGVIKKTLRSYLAFTIFWKMLTNRPSLTLEF